MSFVLLLGISTFLLCMGIHVLLWRRHHPDRHAAALIAVFLLPFLAFAVLFLRISHGTMLWDLAAVGLLHAALSCAYIQIYPAVQASSPTLILLLLVGKAGPGGITRDELSSHLSVDFMLGARIQDLVAANLVSESNGSLEIARRGTRLIGFFIAFRRSLGLGLGQG